MNINKATVSGSGNIFHQKFHLDAEVGGISAKRLAKCAGIRS